MAQINGTNIAAAIAPFDTADTFPTHFAEYGKGGWRSVATPDLLAQIPDARREDGMAVFVASTRKVYLWNASKNDWDEFASVLSIEEIETILI